ncbi:unnamed protein product, partial [Onchocerca ochengi]|uniref:60S ribosomal protein L12 n=1 Tax=Onchocerca ochengi TaxID=42157 RepID=A0A182EZU3_ONCOC
MKLCIAGVLSAIGMRELPYAHIIICLNNKITSNEIVDVICTKIPGTGTDKDLYEIVKKNMMHGHCSVDNSYKSIDGLLRKQLKR